MKSSSSGCRRAISVLFILAVTLVAAGYFLRDRLISKAKETVNRGLEENRLFLDYTVGSDVRFNAVTLRNLTIYRNSDRKEPAATLDHLTLRFALLSSLLQGAPELVASTQDARFVVFAPEGEVAWEKLNLTYLHRPGVRLLERLQTTIRGLELDAKAKWEVREEETPADSPALATPVATPPAAPPATPAPPTTPPAAAPSPGEPTPSSLDLSALVALGSHLDYRNAGFQPKLSLQAEGKLAPEGATDWTLSGDSRSFPSRGADLNVTASWKAKENDGVRLNDLTLKQAAQEAKLLGHYREAEEIFEISKAESNLDWPGILRDLPAFKDRPLQSIQTITPPQLSLRGKHQPGHPEKSDLSFSLTGWAFHYQLAPDRPPLEMRDLQLEGTLREGAIEIPSFQGSLAGGSFTGEASAAPFADKPTWRSSFDARDLALARLAKPSQQFPAEGSVKLSFAGFGTSEPQSLQGQGHLEIANGKFLDVALLGSLLRFLDRLSPGLVANAADQVSANFTIRDGVLSTQDLLMEVSASKVAVQGQVNLASRQADVEARANLRGLLSAITESLTGGQGLVIGGTGPVDKIEWKVKNLGKAGALSEILSKPQATTNPADPNAPASSPRQQAVDSLLKGDTGEAVGALLQGLKERRVLKKQEPTATPPPN